MRRSVARASCSGVDAHCRGDEKKERGRESVEDDAEGGMRKMEED